MTDFWQFSESSHDSFLTHFFVTDTYMRHFQKISDRIMTDIWIWHISDRNLTQFRCFSDRFLKLTVFWQISDRYMTHFWNFWDLHWTRVPIFSRQNEVELPRGHSEWQSTVGKVPALICVSRFPLTFCSHWLKLFSVSCLRFANPGCQCRSAFPLRCHARKGVWPFRDPIRLSKPSLSSR